MAVLSILVGLFLIIRQGSAIADVVRIIGWLILIAGIVTFFTWLKDKNTAEITTTIICIICGIIFISSPGWLINFFPILVGLLLIINSISNITALSKSGQKSNASLISAVLSLILGVLILFHPGALVNVITLLMGITLLINGISDLMLVNSVK